MHGKKSTSITRPSLYANLRLHIGREYEVRQSLIMRGKREMAQLISRSRRLILSVVFVGVIVGAGGLLGALVGVVLALLGRSVLAINTGTGEFIAAWALAGGLVAILLGCYLTMRGTWPAQARPSAVTSPAQATETGN